MYDIFGHRGMIADQVRLASYARALETHVNPNSVVLDIGSGSGIMALLACRAGATKVYAIEPDDMIRLARQVAASNGFADRIEFHQALSLDIDVPEKVDGIVSDLRGVLPMFGGSLASIIDARQRFLKPGGWMVASRDTLWAAIVSSPALYDRFTNWTTDGGFDFSPARARAMNLWRRESVSATDLVVEPRCWASLDYKVIQHRSVRGEASWIVERSALAHGVGVWFDTETAPGIGFSNSPMSGEKHVYRQAFFPWPRATELSAGDEVSVGIRADFVQTEYVWTWDARVRDGTSDRVKAEYRQSTFLGSSMIPAAIRKRSANFVPVPTDDATIDHRVLELMTQKLTVGEIAARIHSAFPSYFADSNAALTRVGDLSSRYSRSS